jgi:hypothetical protein
MKLLQDSKQEKNSTPYIQDGQMWLLKMAIADCEIHAPANELHKRASVDQSYW